MVHPRAPYGRQVKRDDAPVSHRLPAQVSVYQGETYYHRPAIKSPPYGKLIATYFFVGGTALARGAYRGKRGSQPDCGG